MSQPAFIETMLRVVQPGELVTCSALAQRLHPETTGKDLLAISKDFSRRLSNMERLGHVRRQRRRDDPRYFAYVLPTPT